MMVVMVVVIQLVTWMAMLMIKMTIIFKKKKIMYRGLSNG